METLSKAFESAYNCICCEARPRYPDPYSFSFGGDQHRNINSLVFQSNQIKTTKYNLLNFIPKSVLIQYKRLANLYFLFVATLTTIPSVTPLNPTLIWMGVCAVLAVSVLKQAYEDYYRYKIDKEVNSQNKSKVIRDNSQVQIPWGQIVVGDVCLIEQNEYFPADMILLSSCQDDGIAYIETASLDGEKTSKIRYAFSQLTRHYKTEDDLKTISGTFLGEIPSQSLENFKGTLRVGKEQFNLVDNKQLLFRGAKLMNTQKIWGLVAYPGQCSKIMLNSRNYSSKISEVEKGVNLMLLGLFIFQIALCLLMAALGARKTNELRITGYYIDWREAERYSAPKHFILTFMMFFIDTSTIIPISLIVTVQIVKLAQSYFIDFDKLIFSSSKDRGALAKNTVLNEELGQIEYVFTDKTGTLTNNKMTFHTAVIASQQYEFQHSPEAETYTSALYSSKVSSSEFVALPQPLVLISEDGNKRLVLRVQEELFHHYFMALLVCNTVNVVIRNGKTIYQSESPDEIALIKFIKSLGYVFVRRQQSTIHVQINGKPLSIKLIEKFSFSSERKRMSVIIQLYSQVWMYTKGADNVISERILPTTFNIDTSIAELSKKGLRTLMVGMKIISHEELEQFKTVVSKSELNNRDVILEEYSQKFQKGLTAIGATALLDQLQVGVPETLRDLQRADIRVWMLTGDKLETAIEVAKSCNLICREYAVIQSRQGPGPIEQNLAIWETTIQANPQIRHSLVIDGSRLGQIMQSQILSARFAILSEKLATVICCRLLPIQKAQIVILIREQLGKVCLAIGDGGNDVSMLRAAQVGVGLYGEEGMSAVQASDYAVPEFRMLWRLLFVHGRWNYLRICQLVLYFTYKSILFTMPRLVFSYYNAFSGLSIYDDYYIALYNVLFTSIPLLVRALFEQDVNYVVREKTQREEEERDIREEERKDKKEIVDVLAAQEAKFLPTGYKIDNLLKWKFPKIYDVGKDHKFFNFTTCVLWILEAVILGIVSTLLVLYLIGTRAINSGGYTSDLWMCSITIYSIIIILSSVKIFMHVQHMTLLFIFSLIACSLTPYLVYMWISNYTLSRYVKGTVIMCFRNFNTYCVVLFVSCLAILFISVVNYIIFHRNGMTRKILLKMQNDKSNRADAISENSYLGSSQANRNCLDAIINISQTCSHIKEGKKKQSINQ